MKLAIPSVLYLIQNNLLYFALSNLDSATYQVCYQTKILTTAILSVLMLGKRLYTSQWGSLVLLSVGVVLAELNSHPPSISAEESSNTNNSNQALGFMAVLVAACTSAFSGVYFEKVLKGSETSLWVRNVQMGISSTSLGFLLSFLKDGTPILQNGFFYGYDKYVVVVIILQAIGGLTVAVVVRYADNILKGFAASFSIIFSVILECFLFAFQMTPLFALGTAFVILSSYIYGRRKGTPPVSVKEKEEDREEVDIETGVGQLRFKNGNRGEIIHTNSDSSQLSSMRIMTAASLTNHHEDE